MQTLIVALIVLASFAYAAWVLMPSAWRRRLAQRLVAWPGLQGNASLLRAARSQTGCACDGCDAPAAGAAKLIRIVRRVRC